MHEDPLRAYAGLGVYAGMIGRRQFLQAGMTGLLAISLPRRAVARPSLEEAIRTFTGGANVLDGRVRLDLPPLVENGNAVGIAVVA
ncbi:MAG: sulfur oxidation protein SoxY, partial [Mesorhizobium sp.]